MMLSIVDLDINAEEKSPVVAKVASEILPPAGSHISIDIDENHFNVYKVRSFHFYTSKTLGIVHLSDADVRCSLVSEVEREEVVEDGS